LRKVLAFWGLPALYLELPVPFRRAWMKLSNANINVEGQELNVVIVPPSPKFKGEWMFLFRQSLAELPDKLSPLTRAVLFDILALGSVSVYGLILTYPSVLLLRGIKRTSLYRALDALEKLDIIVRRPWDAVYVNPQFAYRGRGQDWGVAMDFWLKVKAERAKEGGKDEK
jgi:hypothetical protein